MNTAAAPQPGRGWIFLLALIVAIAPMSIDMYLPGLPALQRHFLTDPALVQLTLSAYFAGLASSQIIYGPLADRLGRRPPLLFGLSLYVLASAGCALAPSVEALIALRFLQALGGAAGAVITRAMIRDRYKPQEMARVLSALLLVMGVAPILAPTAGGLILSAWGWQAIFVVLVLFGALCLAGAALLLPETQAHKRPEITPRSVAQTYLRMLSHRRFMGYALSGGIAQAGMFAYIAGSPFVFIDIYGITPKQFGWVFGCNAFGLIAASQVNSRLLRHHHSERILLSALTSNAIFGVLLVAAVVSGIGGLSLVLPLLFCTITSLGFSFPNSTAAAMAPFGDRAGTASALLGTLQFTFAGLSSALLGQLHDGTALPMAAMMAVCGLIAMSVLRLVVGKTASAPA